MSKNRSCSLHTHAHTHTHTLTHTHAQFSYALMSGVPPQPLVGEDQTLADASLLNAVIIQRK